MDTATENLTNLEGISSALQDLGFETARQEDGITTVINIEDKQFPVVLAIDPEGDALRISANVGIIGDLVDDTEDCEQICGLMSGCALLNPLITPFALGVLEDDTDEVDDDPVVLVNRVPLGDFSVGELDSAMGSLREALVAACPRIGIDL